MDGLLNLFSAGFAAIYTYLFSKIAGAFLPAFFVAGGLAVFVPRSAILKYLSPQAAPIKSYTTALFGGGVLSVCACGILPLFQSICLRGAGMGPAVTFLFAGPAINVIAILYTFELLGPELGWARIFYTILLSLGLGLIFSRLSQGLKLEEEIKEPKLRLLGKSRDRWQIRAMIMFMLTVMTLILPGHILEGGLKYGLFLILFIAVLFLAKFGLSDKMRQDWWEKSVSLLISIVPKLVVGIFIVGMIEKEAQVFLVGYSVDNSFFACLLASVIGSLLYFGTIVGVVFVHALVQLGLPQGPALALLLAGPSVCIPSLMVISKTMGRLKSFVFYILVVLFSTMAGWLHACDLNHDWKTSAVQTKVELHPDYFSQILDLALSRYPGKFMLLEVKDLYRMQGFLSEDGTVPVTRGEADVLNLQRDFLNTEGSRYVSLYPSLNNQKDLNLYDPKVLKEMAQSHKVDAFIRVRMRRYGVVEIRATDQYQHNQHVFRDSREHFLELSVALISPEGQYLDFFDSTQAVSEFRVYEKKPDKDPRLISVAEYDRANRSIVQTDYFLGLDQIRGMGGIVAGIVLQ